MFRFSFVLVKWSDSCQLFDEHSVRMLLDDLKRGQTNLDVLNRLAFMANFGEFLSCIPFGAHDNTYLDACKDAISK